MKKSKKHLLEHAVVNQLKNDIEGGDFTAISEMLVILISNKKSRNVLVEYLSDFEKDQLTEGRTNINY